MKRRLKGAASFGVGAINVMLTRSPFPAMPNAAWAWEGLRRNNTYRSDWRAACERAPKAESLTTGARLLRQDGPAPHPEEWGLLCFADPDKSAVDADVFWRPDLLAGALQVSLSPVSDEGFADEGEIVLSRLQTRRTLLMVGDDLLHIRLAGRRFWIQLFAKTPRPLNEHTRVGIRIDGARYARRRLDTATQLLSLHRAQGGKLSLIGRRRNTEPLANALTAFDIYASGGGLRDIAITLYGEDRVSEAWTGPRNYLKDRARRARNKGRAFVDGGYRDLLAQRAL